MSTHDFPTTVGSQVSAGAVAQFAEASGPDEWMEQGRHFLEQGAAEQAAKCFANAVTHGAEEAAVWEHQARGKVEEKAAESAGTVPGRHNSLPQLTPLAHGS